MVRKGVHSHFAARLAPQRRNLVQGQDVSTWLFDSAFEIEGANRILLASPRAQPFILKLRGESFFVGSQGDGFGRQEARCLVMAMPAVYVAPVVDDNVGAEGADDSHQIFHYLVAPDFFGFLGGFGKAKILGSGKVK